MAGTFTFELVSPERILLATEDAEQVQLPGAEGDFTVLAGHAPVISTLRPGLLDVVMTSGKKRMFVKGGFVEVDPKHVTVLAQTAIEAAEMTHDRYATELRAAEADLSAANDDDSRLMAQSAIEALKQLQGAKTPA
jgi:F-type H+-transporting ATPase subunit epsilon